MTPTQFKKWQKRMGWSNPKVALELRCSERQVTYYRSGHTEITPQLQLLIELVERTTPPQVQS